VNAWCSIVIVVLFACPVAQTAHGAPAPLKESSPTNTVAMPLSSTHIHNCFRVTTNVFSGDSPANDAAFAEIAKLGVKTIISVDGSKPDIEGSRKHGMRYIHLPIGYDGVPANRVAELVKAAQFSEGPIYVHCHHGKHRGPAAVAVICEATAGWTPNQAITWMKEAGTSAEYTGLYRSALEFRLPEAAALARIVELPEVAKTSSVVDTMVAIDEEFDRLKAAQKTGWKSIPGQPNIAPAHSGTILWEHFRELMRAEGTAKRPDEYCAKLAIAENTADEFRSSLNDAKADTNARESAWRSLGKTCANCHQRFRN